MSMVMVPFQKSTAFPDPIGIYRIKIVNPYRSALIPGPKEAVVEFLPRFNSRYGDSRDF